MSTEIEDHENRIADLSYDAHALNCMAMIAEDLLTGTIRDERGYRLIVDGDWELLTFAQSDIQRRARGLEKALIELSEKMFQERNRVAGGTPTEDLAENCSAAVD